MKPDQSSSSLIGSPEDQITTEDLRAMSAVFKLQAEANELRSTADARSITEMVGLQIANPQIGAYLGPAVLFMAAANAYKMNRAKKLEIEAQRIRNIWPRFGR